MELWLILTILSTIIGGVASFSNKVAAQRKYNSELFIMYTTMFRSMWLIPFALLFLELKNFNLLFAIAAFAGGFLASFGGLLRLKALHHIDTTIYYPLYKTLSPVLALAMGIVLFGEQFTSKEWIGIVASITIPLLLISSSEHARQRNLVLGLWLVVVTGILSAVNSGLSKFSADNLEVVVWSIVTASVGGLLSSIGLFAFKHRNDGFFTMLKQDTSKGFLGIVAWRSTVFISFIAAMYAYALEGPLGIVHTIGSMYILIPIVLSIIVYGEHWNARKVIAIGLSVLALALFA